MKRIKIQEQVQFYKIRATYVITCFRFDFLVLFQWATEVLRIWVKSFRTYHPKLHEKIGEILIDSFVEFWLMTKAATWGVL